MADEPAIAVERVERNCGFNEEKRARGVTHGILYDWWVSIGADHRCAQFRRKAYSVGYELCDRGGYIIYNTAERLFRRPIFAASKADFARIVTEAHNAGLIPSAEDCANRRAAEDARKVEHERAAEEAKRKANIRAAADDLLAALEKCCATMEANDADYYAGDIRAARAAIAKARGQS